VGNDLTRRDLQGAAKDMGRPWDWGKAFDRSAPCGPIPPVAETGRPAAGAIRTLANGAAKQDADLTELIWPIPEVIAFLPQSIESEPGDLIFTGAPAGVSALVSGDVCMMQIAGLGSLTAAIGAREG
jgi:fumarylpyruvate hydrolase